MLLLSDVDLNKVLDMGSCIEAMGDAFDELSNGDAIIPVRQQIDSGDSGFVGLFMPSYSPNLNRSAVKIVSIVRDNPHKGLPLIRANVVLNSAEDGEALCVMNGDVLTHIRTAAGAGLATDIMARPDAEVLGIVGTGSLARSHVEAISCVRDIKKLVVLGRSKLSTENFVREVRESYPWEIYVAETSAELRPCDIICTVTSSNYPVLRLTDLKPTVHINAMGTYKPGDREIPEDVILASTLVVDEREACLTEPGDLIIPIKEGKMTEEHIFAELGELAGSKVEWRRQNQASIFKSVGNGIQDIYAADLAFSVAKAMQIGTEFSI